MSNNKKSWLNEIDIVIFVNMAKSADRRAHTLELLRNAGIDDNNIIRVNASEPDDIELAFNVSLDRRAGRELHNKYDITSNNRQRKVEASCSFSHADAIEVALDYHRFNNSKAIRSNKNRTSIASKVLIIEDDMKFMTQIESNLFEYLPANWDMCYPFYFVFHKDPGTFLHSRGYNIDIEQVNKHVAKANAGVMSTAAYCLNIRDENEHRFETLADELRSVVIADFCFSEANFLDKYIFNERLMMITDLDSTIAVESTSYDIESQIALDAWDAGLVKGNEFYNEKHMMLSKQRESKHFFVVDKNYDNKEVTTTIELYDALQDDSTLHILEYGKDATDPNIAIKLKQK